MRLWKKAVNKWLNNGKRRVYLIHEQNDKYALCKVLNKYDDKKDALKDMIDLTTSEVTEFDIMDKRQD